MANVVKKHSISSELAQKMVDQAVAAAHLAVPGRMTSMTLDFADTPVRPSATLACRGQDVVSRAPSARRSVESGASEDHLC